MSLRTSDRPTALRLGVGTLSVFEELLSKETRDGLIHLMEHIIQELDLDPQDMTREDIIRRRALQVIGAKLIRRVGDVKVVDSISGPLREEFVHFNYATTRGEAHLDLVERRAAGEKVVVPLGRQERLSALRQAFRGIVPDDDESGGSVDLKGVAGVSETAPAPTKAPDVIQPADATTVVKPDQSSQVLPANAEDEPPTIIQPETGSEETVWTMRALFELYMKRNGKEPGADIKAKVERALTLYEAVLPRGRTTPVTQISLREWNEVYDFFVKVPASRGQQVDDLAGHTRKLIASGESYQTLSPTMLNSNYLGVLTRLINFGKNQRPFLMSTPNLTVTERKRATSSKDRVPFAPPEITAITSCPVYLGSKSVHHRYSPGNIHYISPLAEAAMETTDMAGSTAAGAKSVIQVKQRRF